MGVGCRDRSVVVKGMCCGLRHKYIEVYKHGKRRNAWLVDVLLPAI